MSWIYFYGLFIGSVLAFYFSYLIYLSTKGATRAWLYLTVFMALNAAVPLLGLSATYFKTPLTEYIFRIFHGILSLAIGFAILMSSAVFLKNFGIRVSALRRRSMLMAYCLLFIVLYSFALFGEMSVLVFTSVTYYCLSFALLLSSVPFLILYRKTSRKHWLFLFISLMVQGAALFGLAYIQGCCNAAGEGLLGTIECKSLIATSITPFPQYCSIPIVLYYIPLVWLSLLGGWIGVIAYYMVYRFWKETVEY